LPLSAVVRVPPNENGFWVYVAKDDANGTVVSAREVALGGFIGNRVSISRGLAVGERVVVQGATIVTHGQRVNVVPNPVVPGAS
jgi:multidrug efflux pump subunit AcrA (membrane-fusion protein)